MDKKIVIYDYRSYHPDRCNNGGAYGFWETYVPVGDGLYAIFHGTTADFDFCRYCGNFSCRGECGDIPDLVTRDEVAEEIRNARNHPSPDVWVERSDDLWELEGTHPNKIRKWKRIWKEAQA